MICCNSFIVGKNAPQSPHPGAKVTSTPREAASFNASPATDATSQPGASPQQGSPTPSFSTAEQQLSPISSLFADSDLQEFLVVPRDHIKKFGAKMDGDLAGLKQDVACLSSEQREGQDKILAAVNDSTFSLHGRFDEIDDQDKKGLASILAGITDLFMGTEKKMEMKNEDVRAKLKDSGAEVARLKEMKRKLMVQVDKETEKKNDLRSKLEEEEKEYERLKIDLAHAERKLRHWDRPTEGNGELNFPADAPGRTAPSTKCHVTRVGPRSVANGKAVGKKTTNNDQRMIL